MPLGLGSGFWGVVLPVGKIGLNPNPSFEMGTQGWGTLTAGTIGTTSAFQQFGAWAGSYAPTSNANCGALVQLGTSMAAGDHSISAHLRVANGVPFRIAVAVRGGASLGSMTGVGGGTWHRYSFGYTEVGGAAARDVWIAKNNSNDTNAIYIDGVQVEPGSVTTYFDGDQGGCIWTGAPHNSLSIRDGQYRGGGSVVALADLGFTVDTMAGVGMPPIQNTAQSYALTPGAQFQRSRPAERPFTLTSYLNGPGGGTALQGLHTARRTFIDVIKPDRNTPQQPIRFIYTGGLGTVQLDAIYDGGMDFGALDGFTENAAVRFVAYDSFWYSPTQEGTTLGPRVNLGSTNFLAWRDPVGQWGTLGANGTTVWAPFAGNAAIYALTRINGTVVFGGYFGSVAGIGVSGIGYAVNGVLGSLSGGGVGVDQQVNDMVVDARGSLYAGGNFIAAGGTSTNYLARWANAWGTLVGGTIAFVSGHNVQALAINQGGTLFAGGSFNGVTGTTSRNILQWIGNAYGTLTGQPAGTVDAMVQALTVGLDNRLYFGGLFGNAGGTAAARIAQWFGSFGTMTTGVDQQVNDLTTMQDGRVLAVGNFLNAGGGSALRTAFWNGVQFSALGGGITSGVPLTAFVRDDNSALIAGRILQVGSVPTPAGAAVWNGASFTPFDIDISTPGGAAGIYDITQTPDGTVYIGGDFRGSATAASVAQIVNTGRAAVQPILRLRNNSNGTARVYQLLNSTTENGIYFNYAMLSGEMAVLNLTPGVRSFTSSFRGNIFNTIIPGSNLANWGLLPGTNTVTFFSDNDSLEASLYWTPVQWSIDG